MEKLTQLYQQRAETNRAIVTVMKRKIVGIGLARLGAFLLMATALTFAIVMQDWYFWVSVLLFIVAFLGLIKYHDKLFRKRRYHEELLGICEEELRRLAGDHTGLETGSAFANMDHPYTADLDIFGDGSLFQFLNRTGTIPGRNRLASWLDAAAAPEVISLRQQAIEELKNKQEFRENLQALSRLAVEPKNGQEGINQWLSQPMMMANSKVFKVLVIALPAITLSLGLGIWFGLPASLFTTLFIIQLTFTGAIYKGLSQQHSQTARQFEMFDKYGRMIGAIANEKLTAPHTTALCERLNHHGETASDSLRKLASIIKMLDQSLNVFGMIGLNGLFLWNLRYVIQLEQWKETNRDSLGQWIEVIAEMEALCSLGTTYFNNPEFCFPVAQNEQFTYVASNLAHPLLPRDVRIANELNIDNWASFLLITGSNMAGKSTFLRTVGVNLVLAGTGAPVCAAEMKFTPAPIYTSMRIGDSLQHRESTFYAELKRLKFVIEAAQKQRIFIILDEILKGTNSKDKLTGSRALIEQLIRLQSAGMIATHDLALADMEAQHPQNLRNVHFDVLIRDHHFHFDYKLKPGVCQTMNATELMAQMGIEM